MPHISDLVWKCGVHFPLSPSFLLTSYQLWHHQLNGHGFGWTLGVGDGQGGLACCGSWGLKEPNMSEGLN